MDDFARSRRVVLSRARPRAVATLGTFVVVACASAVACGAQDSTVIGLSPPRAFEHVARRIDAGPDGSAPSPVPRDFRSTFTQMGDRFVSRGHADQFVALLWANDAARAAWSAGADAADGAMFVEETLDAEAASPEAGAAGLLVMEKRAGAWVFAVVQPDDDVIADERVAACASCHHDAPRDAVFRTTGTRMIPPAARDRAASRDAASE